MAKNYGYSVTAVLLFAWVGQGCLGDNLSDSVDALTDNDMIDSNDMGDVTGDGGDGTANETGGGETGDGGSGNMGSGGNTGGDDTGNTGGDQTGGDEGPAETAHLFFASGFESNVTISKPADASSKSWSVNGADSNSTAETTDWSLLTSNSGFARFSLRSVPEINAEYDLVADPANASNTVLMLHTKTQEGEGSTVRSQGQFNFTNLDTPPTQIYVRTRWYIGTGLEALKNMNKHSWMSFFEAYSENIAECPGGAICNNAGGQRINFFFEEEGTTDTFRWGLDIFDTEGEEVNQQEDVRPRNNAVAVPFGQWATIEFFIRQGENPTIDGNSNATVVIAIKLDGGEWQELFHITDARIGGIDNTPGLRFVEPFKNYMNSTNLAYLGGLTGANGIADTRMYYDDVEVWDSCPLDSHCKTLEPNQAQ